MAGVRHADNTQVVLPDLFNGQGLSFGHSKMESCNGLPYDNDKHSTLGSPSKSLDPARKKMFKITSVNKKGEVVTDNDADSIDGLDESQTEDFSSEFYDSSKATDLDLDLQDCLNMPLSPDEMTTTTTILVKQKPDQHSQSRFKVVKIETKEPFRRGKWICYDFYDTASGGVVTVDKNDTKVTEDSTLLLSDHISSSSSVHCVQDINDSSSTTFILAVAPQSPDGHPVHSDVFVPIQPAPANQVLTQLDGLSSDLMAPFIAQQVLMSVAGVPSSSSSFHNLAQPGHPTIIQSLPHTNIFPYDQNAPSVGLFQNGLAVGQSSEGMNLQSDTNLGSGAPNMLATAAPATGHSSMVHNQTLMVSSGLPVQFSQSQTQMEGDAVVPHGVSPGSQECGLSSASGLAHVSHSKTDTAFTTGLNVGDQLNPSASESSESIKALQGVANANPSESLKEAVEAVGGMYMELDGTEDDPDDGTSEISAVFPRGPVQRPSALPFCLDRHCMDSPFGFCLTPVGSLCGSPVFMEHYDPVASMSGMFPVRVVTPTIPSSSGNVANFVYNPQVLTAPAALSPSRPSPTYFSAPQPLVFSSGSAFVPCTAPCPMPARKPGPSAAAVSTPPVLSGSHLLSPTSLLGAPQMSAPAYSHHAPQQTRLVNSPSRMSSLSPDTSLCRDRAGLQDDADKDHNLSHIPVLTPCSLTPPQDNSEGSSVAIDNKIEQAMDLVKRHLMYAVREEVEILKQQIGELMERIGQLEYENTVLRAEAKPETLNKLLQARATQPSQPAQPATLVTSLSSHQCQQTAPQTTPQPATQPPPQTTPQPATQPPPQTTST